MKKKIYILLIASTICLASCSRQHQDVEIEKAMREYNLALLHMDADLVANSFTKDGKLGDNISGRDSIRSFLKSFTNTKVLSCGTQTKSIIFQGDSAIHSGHYFQEAVVNQDTFHLKGTFDAIWLNQNGKWLIAKMINTPN